MSDEYRNPEWENLPPFTEHSHGFCVKVLCKSGKGWLKKNKWTTVMNSYGHSWTYKGWAINCAKLWLYRWSRYSTNKQTGLYSCVVNMSNEEVVWCSWRDKDR